MRYYLYLSATHDSYAGTLHIAKTCRHAEALKVDPKNIATVDWPHPEQAKAVAFFAKNVMQLHVCYCDEA